MPWTLCAVIIVYIDEIDVARNAAWPCSALARGLYYPLAGAAAGGRVPGTRETAPRDAGPACRAARTTTPLAKRGISVV